MSLSFKFDFKNRNLKKKKKTFNNTAFRCTYLKPPTVQNYGNLKLLNCSINYPFRTIKHNHCQVQSSCCQVGGSNVYHVILYHGQFQQILCKGMF